MISIISNSWLELYYLLNDVLVSVFNSKYDSLHVFLLSIAPISELRGAIIYGLTLTGIHKVGVILLSIIGNGIISVILILTLRPARERLKNISFFDMLFKKIDVRVQKKGNMIKNIRFWGLVLFVGIPLPVTGAWTGSFASVFFNVDPKESIPAILLGLLLSASIVSALVLFTNFYFQNDLIYI